MFTISVEAHFRASHQLILQDGSKEASHHHDWHVTADVGSNKLNHIGIVMNFHKLRELLDHVVVELDHTALESISHFQKNNPTAENVAKYIYDKLEPKLPEGVKLRNIEVVEAPGCTAKFGE
jgi:6-pyruvoyltetrahydropterin/6-carboxytetrahydropterin synthase